MKSALVFASFLGVAYSWVLPQGTTISTNYQRKAKFGVGQHFHRYVRDKTKLHSEPDDNALDFDSLHEMDCFLYSRKNADEKKLELGVLEEGKLQPICAWTTEEAFDGYIEFVVDEEDRYTVDAKDITIHGLVPEDFLSFGSRQVGGGKGLGNPHGEESELLYYIHNDFLKDSEAQGLEVIIKPELEILW